MDWVEEAHVHILDGWSLVSGRVEKYQGEHNLTAEQALFLLGRKAKGQ